MKETVVESEISLIYVVIQSQMFFLLKKDNSLEEIRLIKESKHSEFRISFLDC